MSSPLLLKRKVWFFVLASPRRNTPICALRALVIRNRALPSYVLAHRRPTLQGLHRPAIALQTHWVLHSRALQRIHEETNNAEFQL